MSENFSHINADGNAQMVDVTDKAITQRQAIASASVMMEASTLAMIVAKAHHKGDVFGVARIAGIQAAKQCSDFIPLCHRLMLSSVKVDLLADTANSKVDIRCICKLAGTTGVEMEALTGASVAALTLYDMCKAVDKGMVISQLQLEEKTGGNSGTWSRND